MDGVRRYLHSDLRVQPDTSHLRSTYPATAHQHAASNLHTTAYQYAAADFQTTAYPCSVAYAIPPPPSRS